MVRPMKTLPLSSGHRNLTLIILAPLLLLSGCVATFEKPRIDTRYQSLNHESRARFIVLHYTDLNFSDSLEVLTRGRVSSHYLIDVKPPTIYRLVDESRLAWHAGRSSWLGQTELNASSIGIEIVNGGHSGDRYGSYEPFPDKQIDAVIKLVRDIAKRHKVAPHRILGHSDIAPQRKSDPGPLFPWKRFADAGLIPWPDAELVLSSRQRYDAALPDVAWFQTELEKHGFVVPRHGVLDDETRNVISAFQMKYRPAIYDGNPDAETAALLETVNRPEGLLIQREGRWQRYR